MRKILVMTDIHIRANQQKIIGLDPLFQFQQALAHAAEHHADAEHLILMGDLTHSGAPAEFELLKAAIAGFPIPITYMLGNHDRRDTFTAAFPDIALTDTNHLQTRIDLGDDVLLCLDTLDGPPYPKHHHSGMLCAGRLSWLQDQLADCTDKRVTLFLHHPPMDVGFPAMDAIKLANADDLFAITYQHREIRHIFAGHIHRTISGHSSGVGFTVFKSTCHQMPMDLRGTDPSASVAEPAAYGIVLFDDHSILAHTEDYQIAHPHTGPTPDAI